MDKFYIKKLIACGDNKKESTIEFSPHLTIIYGASNTGKTYIFKCIKYLFGSNDLDIKVKSEYTRFTMILCINDKDISFTRETNSNDIEVNSNYPYIESGIYTTDYEKENNINSIYLKLLGIYDEFRVPYNKNCEMKRFTLRMILHMIMINEKEIERDLSIILPKETTNKTYFLSHLLYLLYETDFSIYDPDDNNKIKKAKREAISKYINDKLIALNERSAKLEKMSSLNLKYDINEELQLLSNKLNNLEAKLNETFLNGQSLLKNITEKNERLNECNILLNRYLSLESQLTSDIDRLTFIYESSTILNENTHEEEFSNYNEILDLFNDFDINKNTINAEIYNITYQLNELIKIKNQTIKEITELTTDISKLTDQKKEIDNLINTVLKPEKRNIEEKINSFKEYISIKSELKILESLSKQWHDDLKNLYNKKPKKTKYQPLELFRDDFSTDISKEIQSILDFCNYPKSKQATFSITKFDIEINKNPKSTNGKGFTAFFNTVLILAFRKYLYNNAKIKPSFYIIDTPLLGLDVGSTNLCKNNLTLGVYNYFIDSIEQSQLIIIDNEKDIPNIDLNNPKIKYYNFTHNEKEGRYGFLLDLKD